jgi:hypothetical protein
MNKNKSKTKIIHVAEKSIQKNVTANNNFLKLVKVI